MSADSEEHLQLGFEARRAGQLHRALEHMRAAVSIARDSPDLSTRSRALTGLGRIERDLGNTGAALVLYTEALAHLREAGDPLAIAHTARHVGDIHLDRRELSAAEPHLREALELYRADLRTRPLELANALLSLASLETDLDHRPAARALLEEALDLYTSLNVRGGMDDCTNRLRALLSLPSTSTPSPTQTP